MKLFTGVSHFINILLIFCNADGGVCRCNGGDDAGSHGVSVCGPEHLLFDLCGLRCGLAVRLDVERLSHPLFCLLRPLGDLSRLPDDP